MTLFATGVHANNVIFLGSDTCAPKDIISESNEAFSGSDGQCIDSLVQSYSKIKTSTSSSIGARWTPEMTYFTQYVYSDSSCTQEIKHVRFRTNYPSLYIFLAGEYLCTENSIQFKTSNNEISYIAEENKCIASGERYTKNVCAKPLSIEGSSGASRLLSFLWVGASFFAVNY